MNDLERWFSDHKGRLVHKWEHYFEIYDRHFSRYRGSDVHILEIGVSHGGSLEMWRAYFGSSAKIYGIDVNPECKQFEDADTEIFIGDQANREFLRSVVARIPRIDILIDDGGHSMEQQIATYEEVFPSIEEDGVYLCEDLHTSYWPAYGGGYRKRDTFIEYSKTFIDYINAWHNRTQQLTVSNFTKTVHSLHYYDSVLVIEKRRMVQPKDVSAGIPTLLPAHPVPNVSRSGLYWRIRRRVKQILHK